MNFGFTEEERMIQNNVRRAFKKYVPIELVRNFMENSEISAEMKQMVRDQGFIGLLSEKGEGIEGALAAVAIFEEAGKVLLPYPLLEQMVGAYLLSKDQNKQELWEQVVQGQQLVTVAWGLKDRIRVADNSDGYLLEGVFTNVPFAKQSDWMIVGLKGIDKSDQIHYALLKANHPSLTIHERDSMDQTYPMSNVVAEKYPLERNAIISGFSAKHLFHDVLQLSALLASAEMLGMAEEVLRRTVDYTKIRKQFGTEIGRFQALKHMAADMYVYVENMRVAVLYAAMALQEGKEPEAVSIAKAYASEAAVKVTEMAIQMHGGIGFTWECDLHLYLKRVRRNANLFGNAYYHREIIMKKLEEEVNRPESLEEALHF